MNESSHNHLVWNKPVTRRGLMQFGLGSLLSLCVSQLIPPAVFAQLAGVTSNGRVKKQIKGDHDLAAVQGDDPAVITRKAVEAMGGMSRFVKKDAVVVVKPNMAWDRAPEYAANTNPQVVATLVQMCYECGARRVNVFDNPCNSAQRVYENTGIMRAAKEKGARVYFMDSWNFLKARFAYDSPMRDWPVFRDAIECDTFINVPIVKHHGLTGLTLSMKNLMGVCGGTRGLIHLDIGRKLVDITDFIAPDLTVVDAFRVLMRHGPSGGSLDDVALKRQVFAATDPTLADVYACRIMDVDYNTIPYIAEAIDRGMGAYDLGAADIVELKA
ncbi:MAG TPA: DUF362 domain-containing protein [Candidatus Omnitrophota bacterium]|nr:DUF362 domain-containing protein [Candidatus Omnitrophota bacterium]